MGGFPPGAYIHHSAGPKSQRFFLRKRRPRFLIHARRGRKKTRFFFAGRFFAARAGTPTRRPEPPPGTLSDFALRKSGGRHTSPLCSGKVYPVTGLSDFALVKSGRAALLRFAVKKSGGPHFSALLWRSRRAGRCAQPPGRGVPGRGWSDPWVCLAETAPPSRVNFRQIRGWGYRPARTSKKPSRRTAKETMVCDYFRM